ncbi:hypothetical protein, conserved [Entamoeba dispar SAW760]|uniref:carnosine N-methyltransferase n=1 Tax=Entamoeba dispar (strain ATCC PRA-260 / SAW760) TaxID=370354 RepID=B0EGK3_ENTDS|nr:uncharacterized protein EDI_244860 [Entamoeba dispar SAW760]EDR26335.1 hypothetical protein, conserved [Entamoeba dispar SAW760]|eukprot:EDR26335.1 hypothetical protein, conserved [Entamoeba dispar SAW760]
MIGLPESCCWSVYHSFKNYIEDSKSIFDDLISVAEEHNVDGILANHINRLKECQKAVMINHSFIDKTITLYNTRFKTKEEVDDSLNFHCCVKPNGHQVDMIQNILEQTLREWGSLGESIRNQTFNPLYDIIGTGKSILIPGCGLARLPYELQKRGNKCYACECNHFMLMAMNTISTAKENEFTIVPYINCTSDIIDSSNLKIRHSIPDCDPSLLKEISLSDFDFESYCEKTSIQFDVVCTCYFIDTAFDIINYIKSIKSVLKPQGIWVNIGPLHWVNDCYSSLHLSLDEVFEIAFQVGFTMIKKEMIQSLNYIPQEYFTCPTTYNPCLFVMQNK